MKRHPSLLRRLVLWQAVVLLVTLSIMSVAILFIASHRLRGHHDANLIDACREAVAMVGEAGGAESIELSERLASLGHNLTLTPVEAPADAAVLDAAAVPVVLATRRGSGPDPQSDAHPGPGGDVLRVASCTLTTAGGATYRIEASERLGDLHSTASSLQLVILLVAPMVLILAIVVGAVILHRALRPLREVVHWVESMEAESLSARIVVERGPRDINVLVDAFNAMIERLAVAFERVQEFAANSSHELRTPLTSLTSNLEVALTKERSADEYRRVLEQSLGDVRRLNRTVEQLLVMAQTDTGKIRMHVQRLGLEAFLLESLEPIHLQALGRGVAVELEEMDGLELEADPNWLRYLFGNLVENAVKYTKPGGSVVLSATPTNGELKVTVTDSGVGIPADELPHIFDRYHRVDPANRDAVAGVGLGLSIAAWVAAAHGGRIDVESTVGRGSRFTVVLPRNSRTGTPGATKSPAPGPS